MERIPFIGFVGFAMDRGRMSANRQLVSPPPQQNPRWLAWALVLSSKRGLPMF